MQGRVPLHTFRMDIDYANVFAQTFMVKSVSGMDL
jgi:ribosomal protein S3